MIKGAISSLGMNRAKLGLLRFILVLLLALNSVGMAMAGGVPPINDNFANASLISGTPVAVSAANFNASEEPGEPDHYYLTGEHSIWFSWMPTNSGPVVVSTIGSYLPGNDSLISVYSGSSVDALTLLAENKVNDPVSKFDFPRTDNFLLLNALAGNSYQISLDGVAAFGGGVGGFYLRIASAPANSNFVSRTTLTDASSDSANFFTSPGLDTDSVWWSWTALQRGVISFDLAGTDIDFAQLDIKVYTGSALENLVEIPIDLWSIRGEKNGFSFLAQAGVSYQIAIGSETKKGFIRIRPALELLPPTNNDFEYASIITGLSATVSGTHSNANEQPFEPFHAGHPGYGSIWYSWLAPTSGTVSMLITSPLNDNLVIGVYTGNTLSNLSAVPLNFWHNFLSGNATNRAVNFDVQAGTEYQIAIDQWYSFYGGPVTFDFSFSSFRLTNPTNQSRFREPESIPLQLSYSEFDGDFNRIDYYAGTNLIAIATNAPFDAVWNAPPFGEFQLTAIATNAGGYLKVSSSVQVSVIRSNDDFEDRVVLSGPDVSKVGSTLGAGSQPGEAPQAISGASHSVWYSWTAPYSGRLQLSTAGSDDATTVGIYSGTALTNLQLLATAGDNRYYPINLHVVKGAAYQIAVDALNNNGGRIELHLMLAAGPANDDFVNRQLLQGAKLSVTNSNESASSEPFEPIQSGGHSLWWSWTAPFSGFVIISIERTDFDSLIKVYQGSALASLVPVPGIDRFPPYIVRFAAQKGVTYQIAADSETEGSFILDLEVSKVTITNPVVGASLTGPANVKIQTSVLDLDSVVKRVDFYADSRLIGSSTTKPFSMTWSNVIGSFTLTAKATDALGHFTISRPLDVIIKATNNAFAHATLIKGTDVSMPGYLGNCDAEAGEPLLAEFSVGQTAWWNWTAPANGQVTLSLFGTEFSPLATVFTGSQLGHLVLVANNSYQHCYGTCAFENRVRSSLSFLVTAGKTYRIALDKPVLSERDYRDPNDFFHVGTYTQPGENLKFRLKFATAPVNDNFQYRTLLKGTRLTVNASNVGASKQPGEHNHGGNTGGSSVWYTWTAPASGSVTLSINPAPVYTQPSSSGNSGFVFGPTIDPGSNCEYNQYDSPALPDFYPVFGVYTGTSLLGLQTVAAGTDVTFNAVAGRVYQIAVDGNRGATAKFTFHLTQTLPPPNDNRAHAISVWGLPLNLAGYNVSATREPGDPIIAGDNSGHTVWWQWVATKTGYVTIDLNGSDFAFPTGVYTTSPLGLKRVADGIGGYYPYGDTQVIFKAQSGAHYFIGVGSYGGLTGNIRMRIDQSPTLPGGGAVGVYPNQN